MLAYRIYFDQARNLFHPSQRSDKKILAWCKKNNVAHWRDEGGKWCADFLLFEEAYDAPIIAFLKRLYPDTWEERYKPRKVNLEAHIERVDKRHIIKAVVEKRDFDFKVTKAKWQGTGESFVNFCADLESNHTLAPSTTSGEGVLSVMSDLFVLPDNQPARYLIQGDYKKGKIRLKDAVNKFGTLFSELAVKKKIEILGTKKEFCIALSTRIEHPDKPTKSVGYKIIWNGLGKRFDSDYVKAEDNPFYPLAGKYSTLPDTP